MKKVFGISLLCSSFLLMNNVYACGEITDLTSSVGTIKEVSTNNYVVSVPEGTSKVTLSANTDYDWVENYGPREVSTNGKVELKVDGNKCGYGIYTYFVTFKTISNIIAENTTEPTTEKANETTTTKETTNETTTNNAEEETNTTNSESPIIKLSSLTIENYDINFDPNITSYELEVESNVTSLNITAETELPTDSYTVANQDDLKVGSNKVTVAVVNEEGQTTVYEINVTRKAELSSNNYLASIVIPGYTLNFDASVTEYTLETDNVSTLNINVITQSELATYEIIGNENLSNGSKITIRVTAEDSSIRDYVITIKRTFNIKDYLVYIVIVALIIILVILILISRRTKNKKKNAPAEIEGVANTAGTVAENMPSANAQTSNVQTTVNQVPNANSALKIIEPTNIENKTTVTSATPSSQIPLSDSPTEVFKL